MVQRLILTFLFHVGALSLVLFPKSIKGPVLFSINSISIQVLDLISFVLILGGSVFLYIGIFKFLLAQQQLKKMKGKDGDKEIRC